MIPIIDTHCHINSQTFTNVANEITAINKNKIVQSVVNIGLDIETSKEAIIMSTITLSFMRQLESIHCIVEVY